jgi:hypothetical protein
VSTFDQTVTFAKGAFRNRTTSSASTDTGNEARSPAGANNKL